MTRGNQAFQKAANAALVMREIRRNEPISRTEIASALGLTKSTVTNIVSDLLRAGLVQEGEPAGGEPRGGRPRRSLALHGNAACVLGIELNPDRWEAVYLNLRGELVATYEGHVSDTKHRTGSTPLDPVGLAADVVRDVPAPPDGLPLIGIGFGLPGYTDPIWGRIIKSTALQADGCAFAEPLHRALRTPILVDNDANCIAWGEISNPDTEAGVQEENLLTVLLKDHRDPAGRLLPTSPGIGCGIVVDGAVRYGEHFAAGELRSGEWTQQSPGQLSESHISAGPEEERDTAMLTDLFKTLSVAVSLVSPARVVYAGDLLDRAAHIDELLDTTLREHYISPDISGIPVAPSRFGKTAIASGAAAMFLERLFVLPEVGRPQPRGIPSWQQLAETLAGEVM